MSKRRRKRINQINILPLVDVLIVLIFFFMMTIQFQDRNVLNITPPKVETAGENKATQEIIIAVDAEGAVYYNNLEIPDEQLSHLLALAAAVDADQHILVIADEDVAFKKVTFVLDRCRKAGLESIRIQTR